MMSMRFACKASRLLGGAAPHLSRSTLAAAAGGAATAVPNVVAAAASTRLVLPVASGGVAPFSTAAITGERPSLGPAVSGRTTDRAPPSLLAGAIAALLSTTLATSGDVTSCEGPDSKPKSLELKPKKDWPKTTAVKLWKKRRAGTLKDSWPTSQSKLDAYSKKHGGRGNDYREFNGVLLSVISHAALLENIDNLSLHQMRSALSGNGWKQGGHKKAEVKERLRGCLDGTNIVAGFPEGDRSKFMQAKLATKKADGVPAGKKYKAWCDTHGGSYWYRICQYSMKNKAVMIVPGHLVVNGGAANPNKPKESNFQKLARHLKCPVGDCSQASRLKTQLTRPNQGAGLTLHPNSKEFDGRAWGKETSITFNSVASGKKRHWSHYPQVFSNPHIHPDALDKVKFYDAGPTPSWNRHHGTAALAPMAARAAKPGRAQRSKKRAREAASKSSAPPAKKTRRQRKRFGDDGDSDDEPFCP